MWCCCSEVHTQWSPDFSLHHHQTVVCLCSTFLSFSPLPPKSRCLSLSDYSSTEFNFKFTLFVIPAVLKHTGINLCFSQSECKIAKLKTTPNKTDFYNKETVQGPTVQPMPEVFLLKWTFCSPLLPNICSYTIARVLEFFLEYSMIYELALYR